MDNEQIPMWNTYPTLPKQLPPRGGSQPWTTTRCHRLLRPLKTNISALRREIELENSQNLRKNPDANSLGGSVGGALLDRSNVQHTYSKRGRKATRPNDEQLATQASRTSQTIKKARRKMQPGEIILPTPVIRRARGYQLSSPLQQPRWTDSNSAREGKKTLGSMRGQRSPSVVSELESELQTLKNRVSSSRLSLYESLLRAVHSLLAATSAPVPGSRANKSLLAMCLRRLPEYIDELEYWEQRDAEEQGTKSTLQDSKVSGEVYEEVAAILPPFRNGCSHLRQLVRADGLRLIRNAMVENLLDPRVAVLLIKLCAKMKAHTEAEGLLETLLGLDMTCSGTAAPPNGKDVVYPKPKGMDSTFEEGRKLAPLKALRDFAKESERPQFMLGQLSKLMSTQKLPLEWLSTKEFVSIWSGIVRTLSSNKICDDTVSFAIQTITTLASQAKKTKYSLKAEPTNARTLSQQTLLSTISTVATLPLLQRDTTDLLSHRERQDDTSVMSQRVQQILQSCIFEMRRYRKLTWITTVLDLGAFYASIPLNSGPSGEKDVSLLFTPTDNPGRDARQHREAATALICTLAQCMGRGAAEASHNSLTRLLDRLETAVQGENAIPRSLRADCAFFLAERTLDLRDLAFAESFNHQVSAIALDVKTPRPRQPASSPSAKFRWDEGIAEWVTATPAAAEKPPGLPPSSSPPPRRRSLRGRSLRANGETCQEGDAEVGGRSPRGVSDGDDGAASDDSAKHMVFKQGTKRRRRNRGKAAVEGPRKRRLVATVAAAATAAATTGGSGSLLLPPQSSEDESDDDDDYEPDEQGHSKDPPRIYGRSRHARKESDSSLREGEPMRRRAAVLKPYRSLLNSAGAELSDDELGW